MWCIVRNFARTLYIYVAATANANPYRLGDLRNLQLHTTLVLTHRCPHFCSIPMSYSIAQVAKIIGASLDDARDYDTAALNTQIDWLLTDSRSLAFPETSLFFALRTTTGDGHRYISALLQRGVRSFVVNDDYNLATLTADSANPLTADAHFLRVKSPLHALQQLAAAHRAQFTLPVVGITGSNGKTIVKEWLYQLLCPSEQVTRSPRSFNSQIGVPLSVWLLNEQSRIGIFEAGISRKGEMAKLRDIIQPTIGLITNIGAAHEANFSSMEEKCAEKLQLFTHCEALVYCADDALIGTTLDKMGFEGKRITWSKKGKPAQYHFSTHVLSDSTEISFQLAEISEDGSYVFSQNQESVQFFIPFTDEASIENAIHTAVVGLELGVTPIQLAARMPQLQSVAMRLEVKPGVRGLTLIDDAYNADLTSLDVALDFLHRRKEAHHKSVLMLSDFQQTGMPAAELYQRVATLIASRPVDMVIGIGHEVKRLQGLLDCRMECFDNTDAFLASSCLASLSDAVVLLKGAREFAFERIADELQLKVHETTLEINLSALADNVRFYRSHLQPGVKLTCMIKAGAYGCGSVEVARTLQDLGVDYLAVAVADEGAELRKAGITAGILVMNPEMSALHTLFKYRLEPEVYNFRLLDALIAAARHEGITQYPVHIKLDTGMCRLGFNPEHDIPALIERFRHQQALRPRSVFSHFVGSDSPDFDDFSAQQFSRFDRASLELQAAFPFHIMRHICNSAGIERFPERQLDMCRLGLGLYGIDPIDNRTLEHVATLRTTILQIREVATGTSVGYSRKTIVQRPSRIAAIPIGYADGLDRHLGNGRGYCWVNGHPAPYMVNICMDVCMIDVTDVPCREGDSVEIFGEHLPAARLAEWLDTIPYEILTSVSDRVKRVFFE